MNSKCNIRVSYVHIGSVHIFHVYNKHHAQVRGGQFNSFTTMSCLFQNLNGRMFRPKGLCLLLTAAGYTAIIENCQNNVFKGNLCYWPYYYHTAVGWNWYRCTNDNRCWCLVFEWMIACAVLSILWLFLTSFPAVLQDSTQRLLSTRTSASLCGMWAVKTRSGHSGGAITLTHKVIYFIV